MIATDHAPHSEEEKSRGLQGSMMGVVGLETAFPVLYTHLVKEGFCSLEQLVLWMHDKPMQRFGIGSPLSVGAPATFTIFDLENKYVIDPEQFQSKGRSTPFAGDPVWGRCKMTMVDGTIVWEE
jgi:dihydroorotase